MYCYIILCRVEWVSNAAACGSIRYTTVRGSIRYTTVRDFISFHSLHYRSRLHFISFHSISNVCIYIRYSPASRVCRYSGFQNLPETIYLPEFVRGYGTFAPSSIEVACPDADV